MESTAASTTTEGQVHDRASSEVAVQTVAAVKGSEACGGGTVVVEETARGVAPEEEKVEEEAVLEDGSAEASGGGMNTGRHRSRLGATGGPMEPKAASTTTRGQVHDRARTEVAVQTVAGAKGSEAGGGGTAVVEETAQGVALEENKAEEAAALASVW
jgi:hypothetical protein